MTRALSFAVEAVDRGTGARTGKLELARGSVHTPVFMPVGTQAALRSLPPLFIKELGIEIILANTYHLHQRPGEAVVEKLGGLHAFMGVEIPILTDSGGFQVFSLKKLDVTEDGVTFAYELDGKKTFLSPETSMDIQGRLGADIAMAFDQCLAPGATHGETETSVDLTARWAERSLKAHKFPDQSLFGIVQGGFYPDLRKRSVDQISALPFDGYAIGGLSVGEGPELMNQMLEETTPHMPPDFPRYLMGVGRPQDLMDAVALGVDMFDCVIPTRHARSGCVYTFRGRLRLTQARYRRDAYPIDTSCRCYTCRLFSRAYLHHLMNVGEVLGATLCTIHNLAFFKTLMGRARQAINEGRFSAYRAEIKGQYPETQGKEGKDRNDEQPARKRSAGSRPSTSQSKQRPNKTKRRGR